MGGKRLSQCASCFGRMVRLSFMYMFQRATPVKQSTSILSLLAPLSFTAVLSAVACGAGTGELNGLITFCVFYFTDLQYSLESFEIHTHTPLIPNDIIT